MTDLLDGIVGEFRHAVQDARQKVVEEGWFGRVVTAKPVVHEQAPGRDIWGREQSFEEKWAACEPEPERDATREAPERGYDLDR